MFPFVALTITIIDFLTLDENVAASKDTAAELDFEVVSLTVNVVGETKSSNLILPDDTDPVIAVSNIYGKPNVFGNAVFSYLPVPELYDKTSPFAGEVDKNSSICFSLS